MTQVVNLWADFQNQLCSYICRVMQQKSYLISINNAWFNQFRTRTTGNTLRQKSPFRCNQTNLFHIPIFSFGTVDVNSNMLIILVHPSSILWKKTLRWLRIQGWPIPSKMESLSHPISLSASPSLCAQRVSPSNVSLSNVILDLYKSDNAGIAESILKL